MSKRPIAIDDLLKDESITPKYIPKDKRQKLNEDEKLKQPKFVNSNPVRRSSVRDNSPPPMQSNNLKKNKPRFQFSWNTEEDTSDITPLLNSESDDDSIIQNSTHWSTKLESEMTERDWRIFKEDYNINIKTVTQNLPNPLRSWSCLNSQILKIINSLGYEEPTPIQRASIPIAISHFDVLGIAETGSGKTLAYLLPLLNYILNLDENFIKFEKLKNEALALVLVPSRELAIQITTEAERFASRLGLKVLSIIGGHEYATTINKIELDGVDIIIGTPGRLVDSIERKILSFDKNYYLVLDECDRMIDMGFEKDLTKILQTLPKSEKLNTTIDGRIFQISQRQTMMFSATLSPQIEKISKQYLINPIKISIGSTGEALTNINQKFEYGLTGESAKFTKLLKIINANISNGLIIIFANFKHVVDSLSTDLKTKGYKNVVIHGSKSQSQRELAIKEFKNGENGVKILIATDVAARGIDIPNINLVINYQMVKKFDEYIHRIGRTGRAGRSGKAITFITDDDKDVFIPLKKYLSKGNIRLPDWLYNYQQSSV
ncbi:unnamed protein product [Candida verbasci]|uniref:RNA helicase n=1 Tax=Candida verbasci TaxID=1227364 RepID=A0A9W4TW45_9ASCO|nr:unnamed protein product [Candida verbasci]